MKFDVVTRAEDDDQLQTIATFDWPCLPRVGDTLVLDGLVDRFRSEVAEQANENTRELPSEKVAFVVEAVMWSADANRFNVTAEKGEASELLAREVDVEVLVALPPEDRCWPGA